MKIHKHTKFPIELTKGKAEDLYRLRFMRRSELEPLLRHTMRHNSEQLDRQLGLWYKEKSLTLGYLNKEHDKVYQSQVRLRHELRRIKREEYVRHQNAVREKLQAIKYRMIAMKVLRKFRENVEQQKRTRDKNINKKLETANFVLSVPTQTDYPEDISELKKPLKLIHATRSRERVKSTKVIQRDTEIRSFQTRKLKKTDETKTVKKNEGQSKPISNITLQSRDSPVQSRDVTSKLRGLPGDVDRNISVNDSEDGIPASLQGRYPSSKGPRMETIIEEINDEVEIEIDDSTGQSLNVASRKLRSLNRSKSNRDIFDNNDQVPLLPEVTQSVTPRRDGNKEDKGTQTNFKYTTKSPNPGTEEGKGKSVVKKRLVVKLPSPSPVLSPTSGITNQSSSSTYGHFGSDTDEYPDTFSDTDGEGFYFDSDTVEPSIEFSTELLASPVSSDNDTLEDASDRLSITFDNYKEALKRKEQNSAYSNFLKQSENVTFENFDAFPVRSVFQRQNPFSLNFKERSFYIQSGFDEPRTSSAHSGRRSRSDFRREAEALEEIRDKRLADIRGKMAREQSKTQLDQNIAVFGVKADGRTVGIVPPNSPHVKGKSSGFGQRSHNHPHAAFQVETHAQKKAQVYDKQKLHELVSIGQRNQNHPDSGSVQVEPQTQQKPQVYVKQRLHEPVHGLPTQLSYGQYSQLVSPRACSHDVSAMKDLYYRDKLLKAERDKILNQNMRLKKFINAFDHVQECTYTDHQARTSRAVSRTSAQSSPGPKKTLSSFIFEASDKASNEPDNSKIAPPTFRSPKRMLKDCRYLRDYVSVSEKDYIPTFQERRTSWHQKPDLASFYDNYIANVRLQLT